MLNAGAVGYLLKDDAPEQLLRAVEKINNGDMFLSPGVTRAALSKDEREETVPSPNILFTKLHRPQTASEYVNRTKIIQQLENNIEKPLSIVSAPAGYGKSVTVSQWLEQTRALYAWISLDEEHNDLRTFLAYITAAIEKISRGSLEKTSTFLNAATLPPLNVILTSLINELDLIEQQFILVLDDYHKISDNTVHQLIEEILRFPPENMHLSILSRVVPPLDIKSLRANDRLTLIQMKDLCFNESETTDLYKNLLAVELKSETTKLLLDITEGWIVGLKLLSFMIDDPDNIEEIIKTEQGDLHLISEYLISEILSKQSTEIKKILLSSSILNRFCSELLDVLNPEEISDGSITINSTEFIQKLIDLNLFIIPLDEEQRWFRYHHLFQAQMQGLLKKERSNDEIKNYHLKASHWFEDHGLLEESMHHAVAIDDYKRAAKIVNTHRIGLLNKDNWKELERLISNIPESIISDNLDLLLARVYVLLYRADFAKLPGAVEKMEELIDDKITNSVQIGEFNFFKGYISFVVKNLMEEALECFNLGMKLIPEEAAEPLALTELHFACVSQIIGRLKSANKLLEKKLSGSEKIDVIRRNRLLQGYLMANIAEADLRNVKKYIPYSLDVSRESKMVDAIGMSLELTGMYYLRRGEWKQAIKYHSEVLDIKYSTHSRAVIDSMTELVVAYLITGQQKKSLEVLNLMENFVQDMGEYYYQFLFSCKIRYYILIDDKAKLSELLQQLSAPVLADFVFWFDIPAISFCQALLFEGSKKNLLLAEEKINELIEVTSMQNNIIHLLEAYSLQATLFIKTHEMNKAGEALIKSLDLAESSEIISYYVEIGDDLLELLVQLKGKGEKPELIDKILVEIKKKKQFAAAIQPEFTVSKKIKIEESDVESVSIRERQILQLIAKGLRNKEIAEKFFISPLTVKKQIYNLYKKLDVSSRIKAVEKAKEMDII
jgi:LuxR family maltose regulon positive regulatory protein